MRRSSLAVQASVAPALAPQAALVGFAATDELELFFDTVDTSRKVVNLRANSKIAFVIGWDDQCTLQYEGIADEPRGVELDFLKQLYFARFPDGPARQSWPGIVYIRVRPTWLRFSDFRTEPAVIREWVGDALARLIEVG